MGPLGLTDSNTLPAMSGDYSTIGIDFGTCFSGCYIFSRGKLENVTFGSFRNVPSCVSLVGEKPIYGWKAKEAMKTHPTCTLYDLKRFFGKNASEVRKLDSIFNYPFSFEEDGNENLFFILSYPSSKPRRIYSCYAVSLLLKYMITIASEQLGRQIKYGVITVPAYFTARQQYLLRMTAEHVGLTVLDIIPEPTAAAIAYTIPTKERESYLVIYDLGGGTFDLCVMKVSHADYKVIRCGGNSVLGGRDFDQCLLQLIKKKIRGICNVDYFNEYQNAFLLDSAEEAKKSLSKEDRTEVFLDDLGEAFQGESVHVKRTEFENCIMSLITTTCDIVEDCLDEEDIELSSNDFIALVGGSSRIPLVERMLKERFPEPEIRKDENCDTIVAKGACYKAMELYCKKEGLELTKCLPSMNSIVFQTVFLQIGEDMEHPIIMSGSPTNKEYVIRYNHKSEHKKTRVTVYRGRMEEGKFDMVVTQGETMILTTMVENNGTIVVTYYPEGGKTKKSKEFPMRDNANSHLRSSLTANVVLEQALSSKEEELRSLRTALGLWFPSSLKVFDENNPSSIRYHSVLSKVDCLAEKKYDEEAAHKYAYDLCLWHQSFGSTQGVVNELRRKANLLCDKAKKSQSSNKDKVLEYLNKVLHKCNTGYFFTCDREKLEDYMTKMTRYVEACLREC